MDFRSAADGTLEARALLPRSRRATDPEALERHFRALGDRFSIPAARLAEARDGAVAADSLPVIAALVAAADGSVWVAEHDPGALFIGVSSRWDVIDARGVLRRRVHFPTGFTLHAVVGGRAYGVATGGSGESLVHVYDLGEQPTERER